MLDQITEEVEEEGLNADDVEDLRSSHSGKKLLEELKYRLARSRMEVDTVSTDRLIALQGRIATFKEILNLLGEDYE